MTNTNCLEGIACPQCGQADRFKIEAKVLMNVSDDGSEDCGLGHHWDAQSFCQCVKCGHSAELSTFGYDNEYPVQHY